MSEVYRLWAKTRLEHLQPWIQKWALPEMHAGLKRVVAEDAWYCTSLEFEAAILEDNPLVGGVLDIMKCFDQIIRPLLYVVMLLAGFPPQLLAAYANHHENSNIYF
eukprot:4060797-Karenia_brevis.AAC.1